MVKYKFAVIMYQDDNTNTDRKMKNQKTSTIIFKLQND